MSTNNKPGHAAFQVAEKLLETLYGDDLAGCKVRLDTVAEMVQEAVEVEAAKAKMLVTVIERIHELSTPPLLNEINDMGHLAKTLGGRADGIRLLTQETLAAWSKLNAVS